MIKNIREGLAVFAARMNEDHLGAYAASCAYFLTMSFVPFVMILLAVSRRTGMDTTSIMNAVISLVPSGLKSYVTAIVNEVYTKSFSLVPVSVLILLWSAAKIVHALTGGLNVISRVEETRGFLFLRIRSMLFVVGFLVVLILGLVLHVFGTNILDYLQNGTGFFSDLLEFVYYFRQLFGYAGLIGVFLLIYKVLPNCRYTFRSQLPGALIVSTIWMFFSYLMSLYYEHNRNFNTIYGSMTGVILAMIWLYFCMYFLLFGAELNRILYEDPEENVIVTTIEGMKDASATRQREIQDVIGRNERRRRQPFRNYQPEDIEIPWLNERDIRL